MIRVPLQLFTMINLNHPQMCFQIHALMYLLKHFMKMFMIILLIHHLLQSASSYKKVFISLQHESKLGHVCIQLYLTSRSRTSILNTIKQLCTEWGGPHAKFQGDGIQAYTQCCAWTSANRNSFLQMSWISFDNRLKLSNCSKFNSLSHMYGR